MVETLLRFWLLHRPWQNRAVFKICADFTRRQISLLSRFVLLPALELLYYPEVNAHLYKHLGCLGVSLPVSALLVTEASYLIKGPKTTSMGSSAAVHLILKTMYTRLVKVFPLKGFGQSCIILPCSFIWQCSARLMTLLCTNVKSRLYQFI